MFLLVGHARAGRVRHVMATVEAAVRAGETCVLVSAMPQESLISQAADAAFDLPRASQDRQVRLMKAPPAVELAALGDTGLAKALADLADLARTHNAGRVVIDDFSSFVQFRDFAAFSEALRRLVQDANEVGTTFVLGLGEPANDASSNLLRFIESEVAGTIQAESDTGATTRFNLRLGSGQPLTTQLDAITGPEPDEELLIEQEQSVAPAETPDVDPPTPSNPFDALPPFELSIPVSGGDGTNEPVEISDLAFAPPGLDPPSSGAPRTPPFANSGDTAWAAITPIPFGDESTPYERPPSFSDESPPRMGLEDAGYYVDSTMVEGDIHSITPLPEPTLSESAAAVQRAAYPELFRPIESVTSAAGFRQDLQEAFANRDSAPFLVMALRIAADDPYAGLFPSVAEGVRLGIGQSAAMHSASGRLIALIPNAGADVARNVFSILKAHLRTIAPDRADAALQHVNAMAVPNGEPFKTADELFSYAFGA